MWQSHCDRTMIVQPPYDVSMFESAVLYCILFYTLEVPSQLKMSSCTPLVHEFPKIHEDHTAIVLSLHNLRTEAAGEPCDFYAQLRRQHDDSTISVNLLTFCLRLFASPLQKPVKEIARWPCKCNHIGHSPQSCLCCLKTLQKIVDK